MMIIYWNLVINIIIIWLLCSSELLFNSSSTDVFTLPNGTCTSNMFNNILTLERCLNISDLKGLSTLLFVKNILHVIIFLLWDGEFNWDQKTQGNALTKSLYTNSINTNCLPFPATGTAKRKKSSYIFSKINPLNTDTRLTRTLWHVPLVSALTGFHCSVTHQIEFTVTIYSVSINKFNLCK